MKELEGRFGEAPLFYWEGLCSVNMNKEGIHGAV